MSPRTPALSVGEQIANMEILGPLSGVGAMTIYRVMFGCCGEEGTIRHDAIRRRRLKGVTLCRTCARRVKLAKLAARRAKPPEPQALGTKDLSGHWWPKLGRMGPRWGVQDTRAGRVA